MDINDEEATDLDGCAVDMAQEDQITTDESVDALVMFADCWDDQEAVERRRVELVEWAAAKEGGDA